MVSLSLWMAAKTSRFWWRENSKNQWFAYTIASATACVNKGWTLVIRFGALTPSRVHEAFVSAFLTMCSQPLYPDQTNALSLSSLSFLSGRCFQVRCSAKLAALPRTVHQRVVLRVIVRKILLTHFKLSLFFFSRLVRNKRSNSNFTVSNLQLYRCYIGSKSNKQYK